MLSVGPGELEVDFAPDDVDRERGSRDVVKPAQPGATPRTRQLPLGPASLHRELSQQLTVSDITSSTAALIH